jgi:hypothetical protein
VSVAGTGLDAACQCSEYGALSTAGQTDDS